MQSCLVCERSSILSDLLGAALQWLNYRGVRGTNCIRASVMRMVPCTCDSGDVMYESRRSLLRLVLLFVPDFLKKDFVQEFLNVY